MKRVIGLEIANSSVEGVAEQKTINYPNTIREVIDVELMGALGNNKNYYLYEGKRYEVGMLGNSTGSGGKERDYGSEIFKTQVAIALYQLVEQDNEQLYIVYGVPATSTKDHIKNQITQNLIGDYTVQYGLRRKSFTVEAIKILEQPIGTLFSIVYDIYGNRTNIDHRKNFLIDDLGWHTRDLVSVNLQSGIERVYTSNEAMHDYNLQLLEILDNTYPNKDIRSMYRHLYNLDDVLRDHDNLYVRGGEINVSKEKHALKTYYTTKLYQDLNDNFDLAKFQQFPLTGGGYRQLFNYMVNAYPEKFRNDIYLVKNAILANCVGFYIYGRKFYKI